MINTETVSAFAVKDPTKITCYEPATLSPLGEMHVDDESAVIEKVNKAREAQKKWGKTSFAERRKVLKGILDYILDHADELCEDVVKDSGKTFENAMLGEIWPYAKNFGGQSIMARNT